MKSLSYLQKIIAPERLRENLPRFKRPLVFTNGCFDILHRGHVAYLAEAKAYGTSLLVALNSDASVRLLHKGRGRPIQPLAARLEVVAALAAVDYVTWFEEATPLALIELTTPEVLVKGGDWAPDKIVGAKETLARGGKVASIPFRYDTSTSKIIAKIESGVS